MNLREYLKAKKIKSKDFAALLEISPIHLSNVMSGRTGFSQRLARHIQLATNGIIKSDDIVSIKGCYGLGICKHCGKLT